MSRLESIGIRERSPGRSAMVALLIVLSPTIIRAQTPQATPLTDRSYCVVPRDTSWRPADFGFDMHMSAEFQAGVATRWSYPIVLGVRPGSPADSAGVRDGDNLISIDGHDLVSHRDSAKVRGPNIPVQLAFRRGDSTYVRVITPTAARECRRLR